ncbi:MAG: hypothetical protein ACREL5_08405, partial [Gemmatimonadales bacterium]
MIPLLMLASLLGVVTFFLPFASHTSPLDIISGDLWRLAVPLLMPFFLVAFRMQQMSRGSMPP